MIDRIILFSIKNKLIIGLMVLALIGAGVHSLMTVNLGSVPDITNNQVQVITVAPNLGTEDIEQFVTYPVELSMANLPGVLELRSISRFGLSVVTIVFKDKMGTYLPRQLVSEKLTEVREEIPAGFGEPSMGPISTGLGEIYQYTLDVEPGYEDRYTAMELRTIQDWIVKRQMALVPGIVEINASGGYIRQYEIALHPHRLKSMGITISDVFDALEKNNANTGGAYIERDHKANFIRGEGLARSLDDLRKIKIKTFNGSPVFIRDVAEVRYGFLPRYGAFTRDGKGEGVGGITMLLKGENPDRVIRDVKQRVEEIQASLPEGVRIEPFLDRSDLIARTTGTVTKNLTEGALIVVFVLVLLLGSLRGGLITASVIPLALLFAFILMKIFNVWANLMSLGAIDFGIIVDGAVIIVEGTVHNIESRLKRAGVGLSRREMDELAYKAGSTMMNSAFFGQLIILIVFAPILFLTGIEGKMFRPMAYTFGFAILGAIILCLTYVPAFSALILKPAAENGRGLFRRIEEGTGRFSAWIMNGIYGMYRPALIWSLHRRKTVILLSVVLLGSAIFTFSRMGGEFVPQLDEGDIAMHIFLKPGSSLSEAIEQSSRVEQLLLENFPEVKRTLTRYGVSEVPTDPMPMDIGDNFIILEKDRDKWVSARNKDELIEKIKKTVSSLPGLSFEFTQPIEMRFNELITGVREDIAIKIYGEDLDVLAQKAKKTGELIGGIEGVGDFRVEATTGMPQITINYDRNKVAQYDLDIEKLNEYVSTAFSGGKAGVIFEGEKRFDLVVRFDAEHRSSIENVRNLYIDLPNGEQVPIKELADISYQPGPMQISRDNTYRRIYVGLNVRGRDVESLVGDIKQKLETGLNLPPGYYIAYGGAFENLQRAKKRLGIVLPIALALIFMLLYFALKSFPQSVMIYMAVPLAAIGGVYALFLRGMPFSISAGVGFVVLFGVAVLNGLVLINRLNELKKGGYGEIMERILLATRERLRPILLTAAAAVMGFTPMAFSTSAGAEVQRPLATVVIGGLISATFLTLIVVPVLYWLVETWSGRRKRKGPAGRGFIAILLASAGLAIHSPAGAQDPGSRHDPDPDGFIGIGLEEAVDTAMKNFPAVRSAVLQVSRQEALKKTAWDLGSTSIYSGKEEAGNGSEGISTRLGFRQESVNVFGIAPGLRLQQERIKLAKRSVELTGIEIEREVRQAWGLAYASRHNFEIYQRLDSVFADLKRAAGVRLETQVSSRLEYLATTNRANQVQLRKEQARRDYMADLQKLNYWLAGDRIYTAAETDAVRLTGPPAPLPVPPDGHPLLDYASQKVNTANAAVRSSRSDFYPEFQVEYGLQEIGGQNGFYSYRAGIRIPLFFGPELGRLQSARISLEITQQELREAELRLNAEYKGIREQYIKWLETWTYYRDEALPLAREQQEGAVTAYREGAIDYVTFLQNSRDAVQTETDSWNAFGHYLESRFLLEYYLKTSK